MCGTDEKLKILLPIQDSVIFLWNVTPNKNKKNQILLGRLKYFYLMFVFATQPIQEHLSFFFALIGLMDNKY